MEVSYFSCDNSFIDSCCLRLVIAVDSSVNSIVSKDSFYLLV